MTNAPTLLQAITADPDNDSPRLAYANWLDAEGDADRAVFIRVQCALEHLATDDAQYAVLRQRETELLGQYGYRWVEEFGDQISVWVYRGGFIERIERCRHSVPGRQDVCTTAYLNPGGSTGRCRAGAA